MEYIIQTLGVGYVLELLNRNLLPSLTILISHDDYMSKSLTCFSNSEKENVLFKLKTAKLHRK